MNSTHTALFSLGILLLGHQAAIGQAMGGRAPAAPRNTKLAAPSSTPTVTILSAPTGASVLNLGAGNASLNLGPVSYFKGTSAPGESSQRNSGALVITTWFALRVDCPGSSPTSTVIVT